MIEFSFVGSTIPTRWPVWYASSRPVGGAAHTQLSPFREVVLKTSVLYSSTAVFMVFIQWGKGFNRLSNQKASRVVFIIGKFVFFSQCVFLSFLGFVLIQRKEAVRFVYARFVLVINTSFILRMSQGWTIKIKYR